LSNTIAFEQHGWLGYFETLKGPTYTNLVKDFWLRAHLVEIEDVKKEITMKQAESEENKNKSDE